MTQDLSGRRVLVTRAREDAAPWATTLASLGAVPRLFPCVRHELIDDAATAAQLREALDDADWLVLSSARGAGAVAHLLVDPLPSRVRVAAVGPATARAARKQLGADSFVPRVATAAGLGRELAAECQRGCRAVVAGAEGGRNEAEQSLRAAGVSVTRVDIYRTTPIPRSARKRDFSAEGLDDVLLASPSAVTGLLNGAILPAAARIITIGPTTSAAVEAAGLRVFAEARHPTFYGMLEVM